MNKTVKGGDLTANVEAIESGETEFSLEALQAAWDLLTDWVLQKQHKPGTIAIPCGKDTGLYNRITREFLPFGIAFDVLEAGIRKPISDISIDNKIAGDNWHNVNDRRAKRMANWKEGVFAARGGSKDELATQMKVEFEEDLKLAGLHPKKNADFFKGSVVQMMDFFESKGNKFKDGRDAKLADLRKRAKAKLGDRGEAKAELVTTGLAI